MHCSLYESDSLRVGQSVWIAEWDGWREIILATCAQIFPTYKSLKAGKGRE